MRNGDAARRLLAKWAAGMPDDAPTRRAVSAMRRRLELAEEAPPVKRIRIEVNWTKKSRTCRKIPEVTVSAWLADGDVVTVEAKESGCGYDLESSAMHRCLSQLPSFDRLVVEARKRAWETYAIERDVGFPRLSLAGKGVCALHKFFSVARDWKWSERHGKTWDLYEIDRRGKK